MKDATPIPQGQYVPATRFENIIFTAGMTPRDNGVLIRSGKIAVSDPIDDYRDCVRQAAKNTLAAARSKLEEGEHIERILLLLLFQLSFASHLYGIYFSIFSLSVYMCL